MRLSSFNWQATSPADDLGERQRAVQRPAALRESVFNPAQGLKVFRAK